jgi:hypothetical protein
VRYAGTPYDLLIGLKNNGDRLASAEIAPYLNLLVKAGLTPYAYWAWSTLLEEQGDTRTQFLVNSDFREDLTEIPFDWAIQKGQNATYQFAPKQSGDGRSVRFEFGVGRVKFPTLSQLVVLDPGLYRFSGQIHGKVHAQRGLRWTVSCWQGKKIAQTEMLFGGKGHTWQDFQLSFEVSKMDCNAIQLKLTHDSRSTSEMFVSGYVSFRRLNLMSFSPTFN